MHASNNTPPRKIHKHCREKELCKPGEDKTPVQLMASTGVTSKSYSTKRFTNEEYAYRRNLMSANRMNWKRLKLIKKSQNDIMFRRQRCKIVKELAMYKDEGLKKIDSEVKGMKHDLLSYMLKEIEERKNELTEAMEKEVEVEKCRRLERFENELNSKEYEDKCVQTVKYPETTDEKYEEILKLLRGIKNTSDVSMEILSKHSLNDVVSSASKTDNVSTHTDNTADSDTLLKSSKACYTRPVVAKQPETSITPPTPISSYLPVIEKNTQDQLTKGGGISDVYKGKVPKTITSRHSNIISEKPWISKTDLTSTTSLKKVSSQKRIDNVSYEDQSSHIDKSPHYSSEHTSVNHHRSTSPPQDIIKIEIDDTEEECTFYDHLPPQHRRLVPEVDGSYQEESPSVVMFSKDNTYLGTSVSLNIGSDVNTTPHGTLHDITGANTKLTVSTHDTSAYIKNLLASEKDLFSQSSHSNIGTENTETYIKNLLISSQLGSNENLTKSDGNHTLSHPYEKKIHSNKPAGVSSNDTALYIRDLLSSSRNLDTMNPRAKKKPSSVFKRGIDKTSTYSPSLSNKQLANKKMKYIYSSSNDPYNIYTHNKKMISSQGTSEFYTNMDNTGTLSFRKKREISKRIFEKYGPLPNANDVVERIQSDAIFLSLSYREKNGLISCITKSVAEPLTFAKDLLEELFSREVLSISSCKGSPIKTALNAEKLELIRRIVFIALPAEDEDTMWDEIQDNIDTKCRGILRNMKKKLSKSFQC